MSDKKINRMIERERKAASAAAKKDLEALFAGGKLTIEKKLKVDELKSLRGKPEFYEKMTAYFTEHGTPRDTDLLLLFLDHKDKKILLSILKELAVFLPKQDLTQQGLIGVKLNSIELSTFDPDIIDAIKAIKAALLRV